jgi:YndJ-like protein
MHGRKRKSWTVATSLLGTALWAAIAVLVGSHRAPFGIIELLFLFAPLVIVPVGLDLAWTVTESPPSLINFSVRALQPIAAGAAVISLWLPLGRTAAVVASLWLVPCAVLALWRAAALRNLGTQLTSFAVSVAYLDLVIGGGWFLVSRAGLHPMAFQEPIILLTAVHFHYSGFATAVIAATVLRVFDRRWVKSASLRPVVLLVVLLPFVLAAGITFSPFLRLIAAVGLALSVTAFAGLQCWFAGKLRSATARLYVRMAFFTAIGAFGLAGVYAVGDFLGKDWLTVPRMATSHGLLNSLGFVLLTILAWLIELQVPEIEGVRDERGSRTESADGLARKGPASAPRPFPEFVARDFYDR